METGFTLDQPETITTVTHIYFNVPKPSLVLNVPQDLLPQEAKRLVQVA